MRPRSQDVRLRELILRAAAVRCPLSPLGHHAIPHGCRPLGQLISAAADRYAMGARLSRTPESMKGGRVLEQYDRDFLTPLEVAHELGKDGQTVRYMIRRGTIPAKKIGSKWFVAKEWLATPNNQKEVAHA